MSREHAPERERTKRTKPTQRLAYTVGETAELTHLSVRKVNELIATGELGSVKIGRCRRITPEHIAALLGAGEVA